MASSVRPASASSSAMAQVSRSGCAIATSIASSRRPHATSNGSRILFRTELIKPRQPWKGLADVELATAEYEADYYA